MRSVQAHVGQVLAVAMCVCLAAPAGGAAAEVAGPQRSTPPSGAPSRGDRASKPPKRSSIAERHASRAAHDDLSRADALTLAQQRFADELVAPVLAPTEQQLGGTVVSRPDEYSVVVRGTLGRRSLLRSSSPLTVEDGAGRDRPVDLRLSRRDDGSWRPAHSGTGLVIGGGLEDGVELHRGIGMRLLNASSGPPTEEHDRVFFGEIATDTDLALKPLPEGVEHLLQVRSASAPETFSFEVEMPSDASLRRVTTDRPILGDPPRTLEIVRGETVLGYLKPPLAYDVDGRPVQTSFSHTGNVVTYNVAHRAADHMYPLMVDPSIIVTRSLANWSGWAHRTNGAYFGAAAGDPAYNPYGLYLSMPTNTLYNGGDWGHWFFRAPAGTSIQGASFINMAHQTYYSVQSVGLRDAYGWQGHSWRDNSQTWGWNPFSAGYSYSGKSVDVCFEWSVCDSPGPSDGNEAVLGLESTIYFNTLTARPFTTMNYSHVWLGDRHKPTIHNADPPGGWLSSGTFPVYTVATDYGLGIKRLNWDVDGQRVNGTDGICPGNTLVPCTSHREHTPWLNAAEGIRTVRVEAKDVTGNVTTTTRDVKVDTSPPTLALSGGLAQDDQTLTGQATLHIRARDGDTRSRASRRSGVAEVKVTLQRRSGTQTWQPIETRSTGSSTCPQDSCEKSLSYTVDPAARAWGQYRLEVVATDQYNRAATSHVQFTIPDSADPTVSLSGPATQPLNPGDRLDIVANDPDPTNSQKASGVQSVSVRVDGGLQRTYTRTCTGGVCPPESWPIEHTINRTALRDGRHQIEVTATDAAGKTGVKSTVVYVLDLGVRERDQLGLEDFFQYHSTQTGAGSRLHVNAATGNAIWHSTPIVNPGRGLSSVVNLTYNSHDRGGLLASLLSASGGAVLLGAPLQDLIGVAYGEVGRGFSIGISGVTRLNEPLAGVVTAGQTGHIRLTDPDGTTHQFTDDNRDGIFDEPPGVHLRLRRFSETDSAKRWAITRPDGVTFFFDALGYATTVEDRNGNVLRFTYERYSKVTGETAPCQIASPLAEAVCARRVIGVTDAAGVEAAAGQDPDREQRIAARTIKIKYAPGGVVTLPQPIGSVPADLAILGGSAGRIQEIIDHADRKTEFTYDNAGYLTSVTQGVQGGADGTEDRTHARTFKLGYTADSLLPSQRLLNSIEDPNGNETRIDYAPQALLEPGRRVAKVTDRRGNEWGYSYEPRADGKAGSEMKVTDPLPRTLRFRQNTDGRPEVLVDGRGVETRLEWDTDYNVRKLTQAAGTDDEAVTEMEYNGHGQLTKQTDAEDRETTLDYHTSRGTHIGTNGLDDNGGWVSDLRVLTPPGGNATTFTLDGDKGNVLAQAVGELQAATTTYGTRGEIITETDQAGNTTEFLDHDDNGNPRTRIDAERHRWTYEYDAVGNLQAATDPRGVATTNVADDYRTSFVYDPLDRVLESTTPRASSSGSFITRKSTYDDNGNVLTQTDGNGATRTKAYTAMDEQRRDASPPVRHFGESAPAAEVTTQEHDKVGRLVRTIAPNGEGGDSGDWETEQQYDDADRLIVTRRKALRPTPGGQAQIVASMAYDERGNVVGVADPRANAGGGDPVANAADPAKQRFAYTYDRTDNRLTSVEDPDGLTLKTKFAYDENGNLKAETSPRGFAEPPSAVPDANTAEDVEKAFTTTYERDANELITAVTQGNRTTQYDRRADGRVTAITKPEGVASPAIDDFKTTYSYYRTGEVKSWTLPRAEGQYGPAGRGVTYVRNQVGDPETITDPRGNSFTNTFFDTGELKSTQRPSWWKAPEVDESDATEVEDPSLDPLADERAGSMPLQERRYEEWLRDEGDGALPSSEGQGDFGAVERAPDAPVIPRAGATTFGYDNEMRLASVTDARSNEVKLTRDAVGRIVKRERPIGSDMGSQVTEYSFDRNGNLRQTTDPVGALTTRAYDEYDRLVNETAPGASTVAPDPTVVPTSPDVTSTTRYDANGNVRETVNARGKSSLLDYDPVDRLITDQDPEGGVTSFTYDANGNRVRERSPRGNQPDQTLPRERFDTVTAYTVFDEVATHTDGLGATTSYGYNRNGDQTRIEAPGAGTTADSPTAAARVTQREYDGRGLLWKHTVGSAAQSSLATTVTEYDPNGNLRRVIKPEGVAGAAPAGSDSPTQEGDPSGTAGRHATVTVYDAANLRVAEWMPWGERDDEDRVKYRRTFGRDALGRVESLESPFADVDDKRRSARTTYGYYETGWILEATDWHYNSTGTTPTVDQNHTYKYDARGDQVEWLHVQSGRRMTRAYYPNGTLRLRSAREANGQPELRQYTYGHNEVGTLVEMRDHQLGRRTRVEVDDVERTTRVDETWCNGKDTAQAWDVNGNLTRRQTDANIAADPSCGPVANSGGKTSTFAFDELDRETRMDVAQDGRPNVVRTTTSEYWPSGEMRKRTKANGTVENWGYRDDGQLRQLRRDPTGAGVAREEMTYQYDRNGNRTLDERGAHAYNARDQLVHWVAPDTDVEYQLNGSGALTRETAKTKVDNVVTDTTVTEHRMVGDRLREMWVDGVLDKTYHYDDLQNVERIQAHRRAADEATFKFDAFGRMTEGTSFDAAGSALQTERWAYDGLDRRDFKCLDSDAVDCAGGDRRDHTYVGMSEKLSMHRLNGDPDEDRKTATYDYSSAGERLGQERMVSADPTDWIFRPYATDANGTVEGLEDQNGKVDGPQDDDALDKTNRYKTNPYGDELNSSTLGKAAQSNPFRFQGFYYDAGLKTYDMQARVYRPDVGRFLSGDRFESAAGDLNLQTDHLTQNRYAFAGGNPVNHIEWDGHATASSIGQRLPGVSARYARQTDDDDKLSRVHDELLRGLSYRTKDRQSFRYSLRVRVEMNGRQAKITFNFDSGSPWGDHKSYKVRLSVECRIDVNNGKDRKCDEKRNPQVRTKGTPGKRFAPSWRSRMHMEPGRKIYYRFEARLYDRNGKFVTTVKHDTTRVVCGGTDGEGDKVDCFFNYPEN